MTWDAARSLLRSRIFWVWAAVWAAGAALMVVQVGFWNDDLGVNYQDAEFYNNWSKTLAHLHEIPNEDSWQYPPGAAFFLLIPRLGIGLFGVEYQPSFVVLMLVVDLIGFLLMAALAKRTGRNLGVWVWLLAIPLLQANPITRFDLAPTVLMMGALVVMESRPIWFGVLTGAGTSIKVFPIVALFGECDRRRLAISAAATVATVVLSFVVAAIFFGDQSGFFTNQDVRGLQKEAVANIPWFIKWAIDGKEPGIALRNGTAEIAGGKADAVAVALKWLGLLVLVAAALWWIARERAIRRGRTSLRDVALGRDFVFTLVLLQIVVSRVLSPQYMIWLIGVAAVVLSAGPTRLGRPIWITLAAVAFTPAIYFAPSNMVIRNVALIVAAVDATLIMISVLREPAAEPAPDSADADRGGELAPAAPSG